MIFAEIVLRGSFPVWLAIVLMVVAAGIAAAFYFTESMKLGVARRLVLAGLRALVLAAIVFLLCKPVAVRDVSTQKSRPVVILTDNSQSMTQKDPRPGVPDKARVAIARDLLAPDTGVNLPAGATLPNDRPTRAELVKSVFETNRPDPVRQPR